MLVIVEVQCRHAEKGLMVTVVLSYPKLVSVRIRVPVESVARYNSIKRGGNLHSKQGGTEKVQQRHKQGVSTTLGLSR